MTYVCPAWDVPTVSGKDVLTVRDRAKIKNSNIYKITYNKKISQTIYFSTPNDIFCVLVT